MDISGGLAALSLLSNSNSFATYGATTPVDSRAVRVAKAQFTTPASTPTWLLPTNNTPLDQQVSAIEALPTIIDTGTSATSSTNPDVQTSLTTYKALDRLRTLAQASAATTASAASRTQLNAIFERGLADLQTFLSQAATSKVALAFGTATRRSDSVAVATPNTMTVAGATVAASRTTALAGLTGNEVFRIDLSRPNRSDSVIVDLSQGSQPPTLTSVSAQINAAVSAIPELDQNGAVVLDANGVAVPKWTAKFTPVKTGNGWGLTLATSNDQERVQLTDQGASDAVVVASGVTGPGAVATTQLYRFDNAAGALSQVTLGSIAAVDRTASAQAALTTPTSKIAGVTPASTKVAATTAAAAVASDAAGNSYVVGTTMGDIGTNLSSGASDLFLTKLDSKGGVVWQRSLGADGSASGAAVSLAPNGNIVVAGTVNGNFDGNNADGDIVVSRFDANGDEQFSTLVRSPGADTASAVAVGGDGTIYVGGQVASGGGDAFIARLDATGKLAERRTIDSGGSDAVNALAIGGDGNLLAVVKTGTTTSVRSFSATSLATDLGNVSLGTVDARSLAVSTNGTIAVAGSSTTGGNRDGFVSRIDSGLTTTTTTAIATSGSDQVDSVAWLGNDIVAGGRTSGALDGALRGAVDGFVARINGSSGAIDKVSQFGVPLATASPVRVAVEAGGTNKIGALGFAGGVLNPGGSHELVAQTSLRAGDEFSLKVGNGPTVKVVIAADDTVATLVARIAQQTGSKTAVVDGFTSAGDVLRFQASDTTPIVLTAGAAGQDALAKLGIEPQRLTVPPVPKPSDPKVTPGGTFSLGLSDALNLTTAQAAAATLTILKSAISNTQTAYRSLYWDSGKAALVNAYGGGAAAPTAAQSAQLANYQLALARLTSAAANTSTTTAFTGF